MVRLYIRFASRRAGSFGDDNPIAKVLEWFTTTWLRFTCLLVTGLLFVVVPFSNIPPSGKIALCIGAPVAAIFYWYVFLFLLLISEYLGKSGIVLSRVLIIYFYLFSRLVVQEPPLVGLGLTRRS